MGGGGGGDQGGGTVLLYIIIGWIRYERCGSTRRLWRVSCLIYAAACSLAIVGVVGLVFGEIIPWCTLPGCFSPCW